jgi:hypothetical protein
MSTNPSRTLRIAAEYYPLLAHLAEGGDAASLSEFRSLLSKYHPEETRSPEQVVELLAQVGLIETSPDSDANWEVPHAVGEFLRHLSMRQRLATPGQLAPLISEVQDLSDNLRKAIDAGDLDQMRVYGSRAKDVVEAARALSRENYRAIVHEVMRIKTRQDKRNLRERYLFIYELHEKHLKSLASLVEVGGETDVRTAELLAVVRYAREKLPHAPFVPEWASKIGATVKRLREECLADLQSAVREVTPLFKQIRRDHALALAVSSLLDRVGRQGARALDDIEKRLPIARWRAENLFSAYAVEDYLAGVAEHTQHPDMGPLSVPNIATPVTLLLDPDEVANDLRSAGSQSNLFDWLLASYGTHDDNQILQAFHAVVSSTEFKSEPANEPISTTTSEAIYTYYPLRIRPHGNQGQA